MRAGELLALAERVEAAASPDRELDFAILCEVDSRARQTGPLPGDPRYTASIDAAMALASDMGGQVTFFKDGTAKAFLWQPYPMAVEAKAATPASALTAACLRALASSC